MKYFCTSPGAAPFTLLNGGVLSSPGGFVHLRRILDQRVLILVRKGVLHMVQDGCPLTVKAGEYLFLYEGMEHAGQSPRRGSCSMTGFTLRLRRGTFLPGKPSPGNRSGI